MTSYGLSLAVTLIFSLLLDRVVRPRPEQVPVSKCAAYLAVGPLKLGRSLVGMWLTSTMVIVLFGLLLALCGNELVSAGLTLALLSLMVLASNAKHAMLGEPLIFSDLALIGAMIRHPQFYLSAVKPCQRVAVVLTATALLVALSWLFVSALPPHEAGLLLVLTGAALLFLTLSSPRFTALMQKPDVYWDVGRHGLLPTLLLYWHRWRHSVNPPAHSELVDPRTSTSDVPGLLIVIQCESFADPAELFAQPSPPLPGLAWARENGWQWGRLEVSGFGAYTMRTEYGVLFGRSETELGFRRYDPFLTALAETSYALPARLGKAGWRSVFVHPHDMRFYGRDRIMPAAGFSRLIGESEFAAAHPGAGAYVPDAAVAKRVLALAENSSEATLIYAVTMENHGPWLPSPSGSGVEGRVDTYHRLVANSDQMLMRLCQGLPRLKRPATLVFFGDHRPSIPGATAPGGERHTPYVILRLDQSGRLVRGNGRRVDLTPDRLHHAILDIALSPPRPT